MATFRRHAIEPPDFLGRSWQSDACVHAILFLTQDESCEAPAVEFRVNYPDPKGRAVSYRYAVVLHCTFALESGSDATLWRGDDEKMARDWVRAAEVAKTIATEIMDNPSLWVVRTFAELHDYCDANCLGEQETFLDSCGWTSKDDAKDEEALKASTDVLNGAQGIVDYWLRTRAGPAEERQLGRTRPASDSSQM